MKPLFLSIFILSSFLSLTSFATDIPQKLQEIWFYQYALVNYEKKNGLEHFTFSGWTTKVSGDIVTFVVKDGEIIESIRGIGENQGEGI